MTKPGFVERRMAQWRAIMEMEFNKSVGDDGLFPNHSDKDIWMAGFEAGYNYKDQPSDLTADMVAVDDAIRNTHGLNVEIITWAFRYMKENPSLSITEALNLGYNEWIK